MVLRKFALVVLNLFFCLLSLACSAGVINAPEATLVRVTPLPSSTATPAANSTPAAASTPFVEPRNTASIAFVTEAVRPLMGIPIQDAFIDIGSERVVRPVLLNAETLALPVYRSAVKASPDFMAAPYETGPYPKGAPLGMTLGDYVGSAGYGTYEVQGGTALIALNFERLVPGGVYTLWCNVLNRKTLSTAEALCFSASGQFYGFLSGENGRAAVTMQLDAFPPSTEVSVHQIALVYHSDGFSFSPEMDQWGLNIHQIMWYDFEPPGT